MYEDIRPFDDKLASEALKRASLNPLMDQISAFLFPGKDPDILKNTLNTVTGVDDFQIRVMYPAIRSIVAKTTRGLSFDGIDYFSSGKRYLMLSNHRDIVLDPAIIQMIFKESKLPCSEIAVGDNLIANTFIEDLMRSNRMIKVVRSKNPREVYNTSKILSSYIRERLTGENPASVWIAHRQGRTKNGIDLTEQGLLKMLSMSGSSNFVENISELSIMPVSISYEIESCAIQKAYEVYIKSVFGKYLKRPGEDIKSIITGIIQEKGRIHVSFCKPLTISEIEACSKAEKNDRFRLLAEVIDKRIIEAYRIWPTNIAAAQLKLGKPTTNPDVSAWFKDYLNRQMKELPGLENPEAVRRNLVDIFANPAIRKGVEM